MEKWKDKSLFLIQDEINHPSLYAKQWLATLKSRKYLCIYGMEEYGKIWNKLLADLGMRVDFFCDSNLAKLDRNVQPPCVSIKALAEIAQDTTVVIAIRNSIGLDNELRSQGIKNIVYAPINLFFFKANLQYSGNLNNMLYLKNKIIELFNILMDEHSQKVCYQILQHWFYRTERNIEFTPNQYFDSSLVNLTDHEIFVDVGAFDGDTISAFLSATDNKFQSIYGFELDEDIYNKCKNRIYGHCSNNIFLYNIGIWDRDDELYYSHISDGTSCVISSSGTERIHVSSLDQILHDVACTFIKMDIEGAELKALHGAQFLIRKYEPDLAICVYHKPEHLWEVPLYIKSLVTKYKIYLRHHTMESTETVCYAIKDKDE